MLDAHALGSLTLEPDRRAGVARVGRAATGVAPPCLSLVRWAAAGR